MTVISRLFRQAPSAPGTPDEQLAGLQAQSPEPADGSAPGGEAEAARSAVNALSAGDALFALAGFGWALWMTYQVWCARQTK